MRPAEGFRNGLCPRPVQLPGNDGGRQRGLRKFQTGKSGGALFRLGEGVRFEGFSWNDDASLFFVEKTRRSLISHSIVDWGTKVVMERRTFRAEEEWAVKL